MNDDLDEIARIDQENVRYDETNNPMIKDMEAEYERRARVKWNNLADEHNQWNKLSEDEKEELAFRERQLYAKEK